MNQIYIKIIFLFFIFTGILFTQTKTKGVIIYPNTGPTIIGESGDTLSNSEPGSWDFQQDTLKNAIIPQIENLSNGYRIFLVSPTFAIQKPYFQTIQMAIDSAGTPTDTSQILIVVFPGTYDGFELNKPFVSISGYPGVFIKSNKNSSYSIRLTGARNNTKSVGVYNLNINTEYITSTPAGNFSVIQIDDWGGTLKNINVDFNYTYTSGNFNLKIINVNPSDIDEFYTGVYIESSELKVDSVFTSVNSSTNTLYGIYTSATEYQSVFLKDNRVVLIAKESASSDPNINVTGFYSKSIKDQKYANLVKNTDVFINTVGDFNTLNEYSYDIDLIYNLVVANSISNKSMDANIISNNFLLDSDFIIFK